MSQDKPKQELYGTSPAMVAVQLLKQFNALPPEQRRQAIRYAMAEEMLNRDEQ